jgi:hypothetical protein
VSESRFTESKPKFGEAMLGIKQAGKASKSQLAAYLKLENVQEGYYVVFDHRKEPESRVETDHFDGLTIRSYVIPVIREAPSHTPI